MLQPYQTLSKMERKSFIILYILFAATTTPAESSSTSPAPSTSSMSPFTSSAHTASALLEFHCSETFTPALNDSSSQAFKDRAKHVKDNIETVYKLKYSSFIRARVLSFRAGSVITVTELIFNSTLVPSDVEIVKALLTDVTSNILNISSASIVNDSAVTSSIEPMTLAGSSTATSSPFSAAFHKTQSSTTSATFTTKASQPTVSTLKSDGSSSPASGSSVLKMSKTSTTLTTESSKATSTLAASSTAGAFTTASTTKYLKPTSVTLSSAAIHVSQSSTTPTTTFTTLQPTASTLISAGSLSPASSSTLSPVKTSTMLSTESSSLAASSTTNTGVTTTGPTTSNTTGPTTSTTTGPTPSTTTGPTTSTTTGPTTSTTTGPTTSTTTGPTSSTTTGPTSSNTTEVPTTTAKLVPETLLDLEFHSSDTFIDALNNSESQEFKNRSKLVKDQLEAVYKPKYVNFLRAIIQGFRPGSIISKTKLVFSSNQSVPSGKEISETLLKAVETGNINSLNILSQTISVNGSTFTTIATPLTTAATSKRATTSSASNTESHLLQAICLIIMINILRYFL